MITPRAVDCKLFLLNLLHYFINIPLKAQRKRRDLSCNETSRRFALYFFYGRIQLTVPESIRTAWNLPLLLETAVELARRKALTDWSLAVPQMFQGRVQYLLPIHLTNMERPDLAMALSILDGYYIGHTCLTLEMAYQNARLLARPTAGWLTQLVE